MKLKRIVKDGEVHFVNADTNEVVKIEKQKSEKKSKVVNGVATTINVITALILIIGVAVGLTLSINQNITIGISCIATSIIVSILLFAMSEIIHQLTNINDKLNNK